MMVAMDNDTTTVVFEVGKTYNVRWPGDATMVTPQTVTARTAKFITIRDINGEPTRVGVKVSDGVEWALPYGRYSLAPVLRANRVSS